MTVAAQISRISGAVEDIKTAITNKGVTVPAGAKVDNLATLVDDINTVDQASALQYMLNNKTNYSGIAAGLSTLTNLPTFTQPSGVINFSYAFSGCSNLTSVSSLSFTGAYMFRSTFEGCTSLTSVPEIPGRTTYPNVDIAPNYMFNGCSSLTSVTLGTNFVKYTMVSARNMFAGCSILTSINNSNSLELPAFGGGTPTPGAGVEFMFSGCSGLTGSFTLTLNSKANWANGVTFNSNNIFYNCSGLTTINYKLGTRPVTSMRTCSSAFRGCTSATTINFNSSSICTTYSQLFDGCTSLENINTTSGYTLRFNAATNLQNMVRDCTSLSNTALNTILSAITTSSVSSTNKTLAYLGLTSEQATTCTGLSNWSAAQTAGWTTGY